MDRKQFFFKFLELGDPETETAELARKHRIDHNALAHAYTTAKTLQKYGPGFAAQLGLNNEIGSNFIAFRRGTQNTRYPDTFGDLWNNEIGRQIAEFGNANGLSFAELEPILVEAVRRGDTINDKSSDPRVPSFAPVFCPDGSYSRPNPIREYHQRHAGKPRWAPPIGIRRGLRRYRLDGPGSRPGFKPSKQVRSGFETPLKRSRLTVLRSGVKYMVSHRAYMSVSSPGCPPQPCRITCAWIGNNWSRAYNPVKAIAAKAHWREVFLVPCMRCRRGVDELGAKFKKTLISNLVVVCF